MNNWFFHWTTKTWILNKIIVKKLLTQISADAVDKRYTITLVLFYLLFLSGKTAAHPLTGQHGPMWRYANFKLTYEQWHILRQTTCRLIYYHKFKTEHNLPEKWLSYVLHLALWSCNVWSRASPVVLCACVAHAFQNATLSE